MKLAYTTIQVIFIALMLGVAGLFLIPLLPIDNNIELKIVESGSMEPTIMTGSLVLIVPATAYQIGEVVTFSSLSADVPTTHRIIDAYEEAGESFFVTKGDANEEADTEALRPQDIIGHVALAVPYAGFILDFARQPIGFSLLILLPAFMIILSEVEKIWLEIRNRRKGVVASEGEDDEDEDGGVEQDDGGLTDTFMVPNRSGVRMMDVGMPVQYRFLPTLDLRNRKVIVQPLAQANTSAQSTLGQWATMSLVLIGSSIFVSAGFFPYTASYFNDVERSVANSFEAIMLDFTVASEVSTFNFLGTSLDTENSSIINVVSPENGSADVRYDIAVAYKAGNLIFCDAIVADMTVLPTIYNGPLMALAASNVDFTGPWSLVLSLDENVTGYLAGDFCQVDVVYTAWHQDESSDIGYHDEERVSLTFNAPVTTFARMAPSAELLLLSTGSTTPEEIAEEDQPVLPEETVEEVATEEEVIAAAPEVIAEPLPEEVVEVIEEPEVIEEILVPEEVVLP